MIMKQWKLMPLALNVLKDEINGLHYTSCYLAQGAGGGVVQFQVTLHGVQLVTHSRRSLQDMSSTGTLRGWIYFQKKTQNQTYSWVWMERAHVNNSGFRWALGLRRISYMVLTILLQHYTVLFVSLRSMLSHQSSDLEVLIFFSD